MRQGGRRRDVMLGGLPDTLVRDAVLTHPTMAEGLGELFAAI